MGNGSFKIASPVQWAGRVLHHVRAIRQETSRNPQTARPIREWLILLGALGFIAALTLISYIAPTSTGYRLPLAQSLVSAADDPLAPTLADISSAQGAEELHFAFEIEGSEGPLALSISGLFSARIFWDRELIGTKGQLPTQDAPEIAGPIDAIIPVPERLALTGLHEITLHLSTDNLVYAPSNIFHDLALVPYRGDARRPLATYAVALLFAGAIGFLALLFWARGRETDYWVSAAALVLLIGLCFESSRALINYSYNWHWLRLGGVMMALGAFSALFLAPSYPPRLRTALVTAFFVAVLICTIPITGFDEKTRLLITAQFVIAAAVRAFFYPHASPATARIALFAVSMAFLAWIAPVLFLDTLIYVSGVAMLVAAYVWPLSALPQKSPIDRFEIFAPGRKVFVPMEKIIAFVASGDGVDVLLVDGSRLYHSERVGKVEEHLPTGFMRIHRSALIALDHAKDLKSEAGSKYTLGLTDGSALPVSRQKVKALRAALTDR